MGTSGVIQGAHSFLSYHIFPCVAMPCPCRPLPACLLSIALSTLLRYILMALVYPLSFSLLISRPVYLFRCLLCISRYVITKCFFKCLLTCTFSYSRLSSTMGIVIGQYPPLSFITLCLPILSVSQCTIMSMDSGSKVRGSSYDQQLLCLSILPRS